MKGHGYYPASVIVESRYFTTKNREKYKMFGIEFIGS
jgi:NADH:ubiquinone oxidoreductase subunit C